MYKIAVVPGDGIGKEVMEATINVLDGLDIDFEYEYGLDSKLVHKPADGSPDDRGEITYIYGLYKLINGGFGFEVMSKADIEKHAKNYSKSYDSAFSPWKTDFESMAKKTVIKRVLKFAPMKTDYIRAVEVDDTVSNEFSEIDVTDGVIDSDYKEVA